jgi:hypothetical protein
MGRIADLFGEVAAAADDGVDGLVLAPDDWDRLRGEWSDDDIEDALALVRDSLLQGELVDAVDSLSARLIELLGEFGDDAGFARCVEGGGSLSVEAVGQLARRVDRLEEVLEVFRDSAPPDRRRFDELQGRLANRGIEKEMRSEAASHDDGEP